MSIDAKDLPVTTPDGDPGSATTPDDNKGSSPEDQIASYRKRQAGAEAARVAAEARAAALEAELAPLRAATQSAADQGLSELAATKARLEAAEKTAKEAEAKAEARILDFRFPNARKELPDLTDEVKLARFEAMLAEDGAEPPTPQDPNASRSSRTAAAKPKEETAAEVKARLLSMPVPAGWS